MGLFDWARPSQPKPTVSLPQLCYDVAYFVFPPNVFKNLAQTLDLFRSGSDAGAGLYLLACRARGVDPIPADAKTFTMHRGELTPGREYFALEYPVPPPVDFLKPSPDGSHMVLAPHFSALIRDTASGEVEYYILGQAPMDGGTTLRCVTRDGANCNLGPGPEPQLALFLETVKARLTRQAARAEE